MVKGEKETLMQTIPGVGDGPPVEPEMEEEEMGIQFAPDRQICLGDPIKIGTRVFAVDRSRGKKFRKAKVTKFEAPTTYTVSFGAFHKQPKTHRLDIQVKPPKKLKKGKSFIARVMTKNNIHELAQKGDINGVLECLLAKPGLVDAKGGKDQATPLYYACKEGHEEVAKLLLRFGAEDDVDGTIIQDADPSLRKLLLTFGWGKVGKLE